VRVPIADCRSEIHAMKERKSARRRSLSTTTRRMDGPGEQPRAAERLLPLLVDLHDELAGDVKLSALAAKFGTSQFHFHRLFTDIVGETPKKHVERVRLEKAAMLLAVSDDPVLEIGLGVGFKNAETFTRRFKRFLGYTPSGYRRMARAAQARRLESVDFFTAVRRASTSRAALRSSSCAKPASAARPAFTGSTLVSRCAGNAS
jgi:transcriptional regulator GlxA family with amidase domain